MEDYKKLLTDLYTRHDPERIKQIDYFLERYKGKERQFYISQKSKYKSKKQVSDSKKIIEEALQRIKSQTEDEKTKKPIALDKTKDRTKGIEKPIVPLAKTAEEKNVKNVTVKEVEKATDTKVIPPAPSMEKQKVAEEKTPSLPSKSNIKESPSGKDKPRRKKYFLYILGIGILLILFALLTFLIFFSTPDSKLEKTQAKKTQTEKPQTKPIKEKVISEEQNKPKQTKQSLAPLSTIRIKKGSLQLPTYFIACYAVKNEKFAIKKANELTEKGFDATYYWIPDFVLSGQAYFKVVIGPFSIRRDAMNKLTPVQERAEFDAYVFELK